MSEKLTDATKERPKEETPLTLLLKSPQKNLQQRPMRPGTPSLAHLPNFLQNASVPPTISDTRPAITVHNTISTMSMSAMLKLETIACRTRNSEYNPNRFRGLIMRILEPKSTALIFSSGKVVITGAKSEDLSFIAAKKFALIIQRTCDNPTAVKMKDYKVRNIVGTCDVRFPIKVENFSMNHVQFCSYEPEIFPALIYRLVRPRIVLLIFVNGKIVLTGAKTRNELHDALDQMLPIIRSYRKN